MKKRKAKDFLTQQDFNGLTNIEPSDPENDSPGDSEEAAGEEFLLGLNYMPDDEARRERREKRRRELPEKPRLPDEGSVKQEASPRALELPEEAQVVASDPPEPWMDLDSTTDSH